MRSTLGCGSLGGVAVGPDVALLEEETGFSLDMAAGLAELEWHDRQPRRTGYFPIREHAHCALPSWLVEGKAGNAATPAARGSVAFRGSPGWYYSTPTRRRRS